VDKQVVNGEVDSWVCVARLTRAGVERFIADQRRAGRPHPGALRLHALGYHRRPRLFVHDGRALCRRV
jgi:hypothetical protein